MLPVSQLRPTLLLVLFYRVAEHFRHESRADAQSFISLFSLSLSLFIFRFFWSEWGKVLRSVYKKTWEAVFITFFVLFQPTEPLSPQTTIAQ